MWGHLFRPAPTIMEAYSETADALNKMRREKIQNSLSQLYLNAAPEFQQQALDQGASNTAILGNQAAYAPKMSAATLQGMDLSNQSQSISNQYAPMKNQLDIQGKQ